MTASQDLPCTSSQRCSTAQRCVEVAMLMAVFFIFAGDPAPMVNEAHYLVKAKNFWQPDWCSQDFFAASAKAHTTFYVLFGWPTLFFSLETTAWMGRFAGWLVIAIGLQRLSWKLIPRPGVVVAVAVTWIAGIQYGNLAGEWVIGGIEAKVPAYGLIIMALAELVDRRWNRAWIYLGAASAFHVLSGGWSVIAVTFTWLVTESRRPDKHSFFCRGIFIGGCIALLGLIPALLLTTGATPQESTEAAKVYAYTRISHHLLPSAFFSSWYVRHFAMIACCIALHSLGQRRSLPSVPEQKQGFRILYWFTGGAVLVAVAGLCIGVLPQYSPDLAARLLRYYWFRLTDATVPLLLACLIARTLFDSLAVNPKRLSQYLGIGFAVTVILGCAGLFTYSSVSRMRYGVPPSHSNWLLGYDKAAPPRRQQQVFGDWMAACWWIRASTSENEIFLTPRHQQSFKWFAHRAEVVNFKDVPQDAKNLLEWQTRMKDVFPSRLGGMRVTIQYSQLRRYRQQYGAGYLLVDRRVAGDNLPLVKVYPRAPETNENYAIYELPSGS